MNSYDYGFRIYNPAIGKFLSVDPLTGSYPMLTPYQFASNTPIQAIDLDGLEAAWGMGLVKAQEGKPKISLQESFNVTKSIKAFVFKMGFDTDLPKKLIDNYVYGKGEPIVLTDQELIDANIRKTGIQGANLRLKDIENFENALKSIGTNDSKEVALKVLSGARTSGTLGRFTITFEGTLTKGATDEIWEFSGTMEFFDEWDFNTDEQGDGKTVVKRSEHGQEMTEFANKYLEGDGFEIRSRKIKVRQSNKQKSVSYFDDKTPKPVPNRVMSNEDFAKDVVEDVKE